MDSISGSRSIPSSTQSEEAFDAFWEEEARNPHRNRIRIGRTYQASIPPKLKQGEIDGRRLEDLETIYWHKQPLHKNGELNDYFSVAKLVSLFTRYKMLEKSKADRESQQHSSSNNTEASVSNNGIANKREFTNGCTIESHQTLDQQLIDIYNFVSTHHPPTKDEGCSSSATSGQKDEWTVNEARIFASALEIYGKNFGAIKKALPWKPVKSLMEQYYSSNEDGTSDEDDDYLSPKETEFLSAKSKNFQTLTVATCLTPQINHLLNGHNLSSKTTTDNGLIIPGQEVKALKAKPIIQNHVVEPLNGHSLLGSLKFFMDGQLVLKLNAKPQEMSKKCAWVESLDTPKVPKPVLKKKLRVPKLDVDSRPDSVGRSSVRSEDTGEESSDDDSLGSADSRSLPSPSFVPRFRGSKIRVESNCNVPLPFTLFNNSPNSAVKDGNDILSKCKSDQKRVSENHALLLPEAKKRLKLSPELDPSIDLNHENKVSMKLVQERIQFPSLYSPLRASHGQNNNGDAVDLSCKPSSNPSNSTMSLSVVNETTQGSSEQSRTGYENCRDVNEANWIQSYLPFYQQYYRYCSKADASPTSSRRAAQSVSPPNSTGDEVEVPSRPKSTSSTTPSPKEKRKSDWNKKSPRK